MSDDNRTVSTDALETLGTIIDDKEKRDAIHLAVIPVEAKQRLIPAQDVGIGGTGDNPVGIVDPFLRFPVFPGQWFWLVIYPRKIDSLRHVWSHPDIPDDETARDEAQVFIKETVDKEIISSKWINDWACIHGFTFQEIMECAQEWLIEEEMYIGGAEMEGERVPDEFWTHYEIVTGQIVEDSKKRNFFGCSC